MTESCDAVVIGAGLGGLGAALTLARAGKRVVVLERHSRPGGYAQAFKRKQTQFDVSLHAFDGVAPGGWGHFALSSLGLDGALQWRAIDPFYEARFPGHTVRAHADPIAYERELARHFPAERRGIRELFRKMLGIFYETRRLRSDLADGLFPDEKIEKAFPSLIPTMGKSVEELFRSCISDPQLLGVLSAEWTYYGLPPSLLSGPAYAVAWASYHHHGAHYPVGGVAALVDALTRELERHGARVLCNEAAQKLEVEQGRVTRIHTQKGRELAAELVISNANPRLTLLELLGAEHIPGAYVERIKSSRPSLSTLNLQIEVDATRIQRDHGTHELYLVEDYDPEAQYRAIEEGDWKRTPLLLVDYHHLDPGSAPPGKHAYSIMSLAPFGCANTWGTGGALQKYSGNPGYLKAKEEASQLVLERVDRLIPGFRGAITGMRVATPLTNHRYTGNDSGAIFGSQPSYDNVMLSRLGVDTPIDNLWLAGAWTNPGGGQSAALISGIDAAERALKQPGKARATAPHPTFNGGPAPSFSQVAVGSGRTITAETLGPYPILLVFCTAKTARLASEAMTSIRQRYPLVHQLAVVNVVALKSVPGLLRGIVARRLEATYRRACEGVPSHVAADQYVVILADWRNELCAAFGASELERAPMLVLLDRARVIRAKISYEPGAAAEQLYQLIRWC